MSSWCSCSWPVGCHDRRLDLLPHLHRWWLEADTLSQLPHQAADAQKGLLSSPLIVEARRLEVSLYAHAAQSLLWNAVLSRRTYCRTTQVGVSASCKRSLIGSASLGESLASADLATLRSHGSGAVRAVMSCLAEV